MSCIGINHSIASQFSFVTLFVILKKNFFSVAYFNLYSNGLILYVFLGGLLLFLNTVFEDPSMLQPLALAHPCSLLYSISWCEYFKINLPMLLVIDIWDGSSILLL